VAVAVAVGVGVAVLVAVLVGVGLDSRVITTNTTRGVGVIGISVLVGTSVGVGVAVSGIRAIWVPRVGVFERVAALQRDNRGKSQTSRAINANPKTPASTIHQFRLAGSRPFWIRRCSAGKRSPAWPRKTGQV